MRASPPRSARAGVGPAPGPRHNLVSANRTLRMELANSRSSRSGKLDYSLVPSIAFAGPARARAAVRIAIRKQGIAG
eukprot:gene12143-biopygen4914